jgi:hypothetical protein
VERLETIFVPAWDMFILGLDAPKLQQSIQGAIVIRMHIAANVTVSSFTSLDSQNSEDNEDSEKRPDVCDRRFDGFWYNVQGCLFQAKKQLHHYYPALLAFPAIACACATPTQAMAGDGAVAWADGSSARARRTL